MRRTPTRALIAPGLFFSSRRAIPSNSSLSALGIATLSPLVLTLGVSSRAHAMAKTIEVKLVKSYPHDPNAFTQGLELDPANPNQYLESTGHYGQSTLRRVALDSGKVISKHELSRHHFGEGLTRVGEQLVQLTWRAGQALRYDARTFSPLAPWEYQGEGWGICFDGQTLWMSDGSSTLTARNPADFKVLRTISVRYNDQALDQLNELECARGKVYANVWHQDWIAEIDPKSGKVTQRINAAALRSQAGPNAGTLNGIAYSGQGNTFLLTGKNWSKIFQVEIALETPSAPDSGAAGSKGGPAQKSGKQRGCAFFSATGSTSLGILAGLGAVFGGWGDRRRRQESTAKCASLASSDNLPPSNVAARRDRLDLPGA